MASDGTEVFYVPEFDVTGDGPRANPIAAATLPSDLDPKGVHVSVMYHYGRNCWHLETEYASIQKATHYEPGSLQSVIERFEKLTSCKLPPIRVNETGYGVFDAASGTLLHNPWRLVDGGVYLRQREGYPPQRYLSKLPDAGEPATASVVLLYDDDTHDRFWDEPARFFTAKDWDGLSLIKIGACAISPRTVFHITPASNVASIKRDGLVPAAGPRCAGLEDQTPAVHCYVGINTVEEALQIRLDEAFGLNVPLALLAIEPPDGTTVTGREVALPYSIDPASIQVVTHDADVLLRTGRSPLNTADPEASPERARPRPR
jgi:hypothetical protein